MIETRAETTKKAIAEILGRNEIKATDALMHEIELVIESALEEEFDAGYGCGANAVAITCY